MSKADLISLAELAADELQGTCKSLAEAGLDELIFECERCNWWCEISEMSEDGWYCDE